jgi:hypothetical protein
MAHVLSYNNHCGWPGFPQTVGCIPIFFVVALVASEVGRAESISTVRASQAGARLDSDLLQGGGSDDTAKLQAVLDRAKDGTSLHLVVDGPALVSGLNVHGYTTVECLNGGGFYLKDGSSRALVRNANRSRGQVTDRNIVIRGCFLNGNRKNQPSTHYPRPDLPFDTSEASGFTSNKEADGTFMSGLQFMGVHNLTIEDVTLWNVRAFGIFIANAERTDIRRVTVDHGGGPHADNREYSMTDGLHFKGPLRYLNVHGARIRVGDDAIAINANDYDTDDLTKRDDFGPYVGQGPITDVIIDTVQLMESNLGIRLLSSTERIDRIVIRNVVGTVRSGYAVNISHWTHPTRFGNFGSIMLDTLHLDRWSRELPPVVALEKGWRKYVSHGRDLAKELADGVPPYITINGQVEVLSLRNVVTKVSDERPVLRLGPDARVGMLTAELTVHDPQLKAVPVRLEEGSRVELFKLDLDWQGTTSGHDKNPIQSWDGGIGELR